MPSFDQLIMYGVSLFIAMDPFGIMPLYFTAVRSLSVKRQNRMLIESFIVSLALGMIFAVGGFWIFRALGMELNDFRIGGGLVFLIIAIQAIIKSDSSDEKISAKDRMLFGIVPVAVPGIVGPAVITNLVFITRDSSFLWSLLIFTVCLIITYGILFVARYIIKAIGTKGLLVLSKIFALLLVGMAVMFIRTGLMSLIK